MPGVKRIIGYKPDGAAPGWGGGTYTTGLMRGSFVPAVNNAYWIARIGARVGKAGSSATSIRYAAYKSNKSTRDPENLLGRTDAFPVNILMVDRVSGGPFERDVISPIPIGAGVPINLSILGTGNPWAHGQDNSGATMYEQSVSGATPPATFHSTNTRPEGLITIWGVAYDNVAPEIPLWTEESGGVKPGHGHSTIDETPTIEFDFRSANEDLPGFEIGEADRLTKYQVQIYNQSKTSKVYDSGLKTATAGQVAARRVAVTPTDELTPGTYIVRAQVYNYFGTRSLWREWTITVVGGGSLSITSPTGLTNDTQPDITWSYSHKQGLAMDKIVVRVTDKSGKNIIRPDVTVNLAPNPSSPSTGVLAWGQTGWAGLPAGGDYAVIGYSIDTNGQPAPESAPVTFHINAPPYVPINRTPLPGTVVTSPPSLAAMARDADNVAASTPTEFAIRSAGDTGDGVSKLGTYDRLNNRWRYHTLVGGTIAPSAYGLYEWRTRSTDQYGAVGEWSSWLLFEYAELPILTIVEPTGTIDRANPHFAWTVSRAQVSYRLQLHGATDGEPIMFGDTGWVDSTTTSHDYVSLTLRHEHPIRATLSVITTGGVPVSTTWEFDVFYPSPPSITGVTADLHAMPYDYNGIPTAIKVSWTAVAALPEPFSDYVIRRVPQGGGDAIDIAVISDINTVEFIDTEPPVGVALEYQVIQRVWNALDLIPSAPASAQAILNDITGAVITPVIGGASTGVVLVFYESIDFRQEVDVTIRDSWSPTPRISRGPRSYRSLSIKGTLVGVSESGTDWMDDAHTLRELNRTWIDSEGRVRSHVVCLRTWDGFVIYGEIVHFSETMGINRFEREVQIEFVESSYTPGVMR